MTEVIISKGGTTMKKLIALLLAVAMVMSMVCFAGAEDFTDAAEIDTKNTEAVTVLSEMKIIAGMGDGTFAPKGTLTRAQAAKIICYMLLGADKAEALAAADGKFADVPASHWSNKYVNYCAEQGIAAGTGANKFNPNGKLTGLAFGKMLLCGVAGFDAAKEGLTGDGWDKNANKLLKDEKLNIGVTVNNKDLSREDACHLALNFLFYGEDEDPEGTLAYETFGATRNFGKTLKANLGRPSVIYTTENADTCWEGTDLELLASPFITFPGQFTVDKVYNAVGGMEFDVEHMLGYRNACGFNRTTFDTPVMQGATARFNCSGPGVYSEFYLDNVQQMLYYINLGTRCYKITAVTEASIAADGSILEPGSVTVEGDKTCECNDFTPDDVGSYALCLMLGKTSWKESESLYSAKKANIVTGTLDSEEGIKVGGKNYTCSYATMSSNQGSISATAKEYIAGGGSVGDTVSVVLDENNVAYGIFQ